MKLQIIRLLLIPSAMLLLSIAGCGGEEQPAKSMDQIQQEEGFPVQLEKVEYKPFEKFQNYFGKLTGIKEATKGAPFGGRIEYINYKVGYYVEADQVVVEFPADAPGSMYEQAKVTYENSKKLYERTKVLLGAGETSQANFDNVEAQYLVNKTNYENARQLTFIEAPFSGTVVDIKVNVGDNVNKDTPLFTVAQLHKMRVKIWITEKEIGQIKKGLAAEMEFGGKIYKGKIVEISLALDPTKQAFFAEIEFDNSKKELKTGVTVEVKVLIYQNPKAIIIPRNIVMNDDGGRYVFVEKDGRAEKRYLTNGQESGIYYEISSGLQVSDNLITNGGSQLTDGAKVKVIQ
ncbi:MAG: efflux RND transporter periplasmic adaptor subunit [Ignavibacteriaceae bacterium]|nr:efflux RND transporter periplasmic adaptor subunit [Ignavibacteriaceae bacterium]